MKFEWVTAPPAESVVRVLEGLVGAEMIDEEGRLTSVGEKVAECPVEVQVARMVREILVSARVRLLTFPNNTAVQLQGIQMWRRDVDDCSDDHCSGTFP